MSDWFEKGEVVGDWKTKYGSALDRFDTIGSVFNSLSCEAVIESLDNYNLYHQLLHKCSPLAAILYKRAEAFASGNVEVLNRNTGNSVRGINKDWQKLIDKPNWMQTKTEFLQQLHLYIDLYGWCYVLPLYPAGYEDRPYALWILPPSCTHVEVMYNKAYYKYSEGESIRQVTFTCNGESTKLDENKLILFKDTKTPINCNTWLPESRICSLRYPLAKLIASEEAGVTLMQNRGAIGILSNGAKDVNGTIPMTPDEKKQVQDDFKARYGLTRNQSQFIITNAAIEWQPMSFDVKQLQLPEAYLQAVKDICEAYNYPFTLSAHTDTAHYNNLGTGDRQLIQNIIPEAKVIFEQLDYGVNAVENNIEVWCDYSKHPALQASIKEKAEGLLAQNNAYLVLYNNDMITPNQWLEKLGENKVDDPDFNLYRYQRAAIVEANERAAKAVNNGAGK